jgi:hypothetical protein
MLIIENIRVWTLSRDSLTITWSIRNTTLDLSGFTLTVLRSDSQVGEFTEVIGPFNAEGTEEVVDTSVNLYSKWREHCYRVRVTRSSDGETLEFGSTPPDKVVSGTNAGGVVMESPPDLQALEAIRRFDLMLKEYSGRKVLALTQRTWGTRCSECWDALKRRRKTSNCAGCYDTGLMGGYFSPRESWCMKAPDREVVALNRLTELQPHDVTMIFSAMPRLKPRDLIIDPDGRRWRVLMVGRSEKLWSLTHQSVALRELSRDQVEYTLDISDWAIDPFSASPPRQHIAATDIDSYYKRAQQLGVTEK